MTKKEAWQVESLYFRLGPCAWNFAAMDPTSRLHKAEMVLKNF